MTKYYEKYLKYKNKYLKLKQLEITINGGMLQRKLRNVKKKPVKAFGNSLFVLPKKILWNTLVVPVVRSIDCENDKVILSNNIIDLQSKILNIICISTKDTPKLTDIPYVYYTNLKTNTYILHPYFKYKIMSSYMEQKKLIIFKVYNEIKKYIDTKKTKLDSKNLQTDGTQSEEKETYIDTYAKDNVYFKNILDNIYIKHNLDINTYLDMFFMWIKTQYIIDNTDYILLNNNTSYYFVDTDTEENKIHINNLESHIQSMPSTITINNLHDVFTTIINETTNENLQASKFDTYKKEIFPKIDCLFTYSPLLHTNNVQDFTKTGFSIFNRNTFNPLGNLINQNLFTPTIEKTSEVQLFYYLISFLNTINDCITGPHYNSILLVESGYKSGKIHALVNNINTGINYRNIPIQSITTGNTKIKTQPNNINKDNNNIIKYTNTPYNLTNNNASGYYIYLYDSTTLNNNDKFQQILKDLSNKRSDSKDENKDIKDENKDNTDKIKITIDEYNNTIATINTTVKILSNSYNIMSNNIMSNNEKAGDLLEKLQNTEKIVDEAYKKAEEAYKEAEEAYKDNDDDALNDAYSHKLKYSDNVKEKIQETNQYILVTQTAYDLADKIFKHITILNTNVENTTNKLNKKLTKAKIEVENATESTKSKKDANFIKIDQEYNKLLSISTDIKTIYTDANTIITKVKELYNKANNMQTDVTNLVPDTTTHEIHNSLSQLIKVNNNTYRCYSNLEIMGGTIHRLLVNNSIYCKINSNFISFNYNNNNKFLLHLKNNRLSHYKKELEIKSANYDKFLLLHSILMYYLTQKSYGPYVSMLSLNLICNPLLGVNQDTYNVSDDISVNIEPQLIKYTKSKNKPIEQNIQKSNNKWWVF